MPDDREQKEPVALDDLDPLERSEYQALPREIQPSPMLEARTVRSLQDRGILVRSGLKARAMGPAVAAAAVFFAVGLGLGQWIGSQSVSRAVVSANERSALQQALLVQETGTAYVRALTAMSRLAETGDAEAVDQGREVALTALYAAAGELARIAPGDPLPIAIKRAFDITRDPPQSASGTEVTNEAWF